MGCVFSTQEKIGAIFHLFGLDSILAQELVNILENLVAMHA